MDNIHSILRNLYLEMTPLCEDMIPVSQGIAALGTLIFVAVRVWQALAKAEPIEVQELFRPLAISIAILLFPTLVLGSVNMVLSPIVQGTHRILDGQTIDMNEYQKQKDRLEYEAMIRNPETAYLVSDEEMDRQLEELGWGDKMATMTGMYLERGAYQMRTSIRNLLREILELLFMAASLVIDTIRTFFLIVLSILGPLAFAISVWDGFQTTLSQWFCRYIGIYLWLPVSDIFSAILAKIQTLILENDIAAMSADPSYSPDVSSGVYLIFYIIGIIGYFCVPTVASWIIQTGGTGSYYRNITQNAARVANVVGGAAGATAGNIIGRIRGK